MHHFRLFLLAAVAMLSACAVQTTGNGVPSMREALGEHVPGGFQNEVMVVGTPHLARYAERLQPEHLAATLDALARFRPTRIAVENLPAEEIALLGERAQHDPAAAELLTMFGGETLEIGRQVQAHEGIGWVEAGRRANELLERGATLTAEERSRLVLWLLAAYDWPSAVLQWSYLPAAARRDAAVADAVRERLDAALSSMNEIHAVAVPLARRLGLQRLHSVDSQVEAVRTLALPPGALEALFGDPARRTWREPKMTERDDAIRERAMRAGDLLPWYRWMNSRAFMKHDARQWLWLMNESPADLDRFRYGMWELRNQRIVSNVLDAATSTGQERLVVLIGSAHKLYLDDALAALLSVRLQQLETFVH